MTALAGWQNFYVIVGSSAGALIGLQFVVLTLIADMPVARGQAQAGAAFGTPTIVHFGAVLLLSGILTAPWQNIAAAAVLSGVLGLGGIVYGVVVTRRMRSQKVYRPEFEDWLFHSLLPFAAYATLAGSAIATRSNPATGPFGIAAAVLLLLFIGIHNAWDAVTYHVFVQRREEKEDQRPD
jgi:hypothetical protein